MARHYDEVGTRCQAVDLLSKCLSQQSLDPIAFNRTADLARYGQPQARRLIASAREHVEDQIPSGVRPSMAKDPVELGATREPRTPRPWPSAAGNAH